MTRGAGKADQRAGLGNVHIAQHGVGGGDAAGGGVGEDDDEGQAGFAQAQHGDGGARHLHQREDALLHARAARGDEQHERGLALAAVSSPVMMAGAGGHAERAAHEVEILHGHGDVAAVELAGGDEHRILGAGLGAAFLEAVGIALLVAELQRVLRHAGAAAPDRNLPSSKNVCSRSAALIFMW